MLQAWFNIAVGIWLIICSFVPALQAPASILIAGIVAFIFGLWGSIKIGSWQSIINGIIGIWLFLSGVWFHIIAPWNFLIFGIIMLILAIWNEAEHFHPMQPITH